ncbi:hypothetical protein [Aeromicrobium endophyticum]|uniref:Uncharacterized protein n=1 Tax=Aeromicrobium endophyticum TaxID=2292704 RepID=A0A371PB19_9ACTN|nr:hypothetical protein [Aeromicrobium endophyticum]REK72746.1 hypothetical protein DX116_03855 [Aeromicrobium endophyticum]
MPGLLEALSALGVPDASLPGELEAYGDQLLASVDLADLNDAAAVTKAATECSPEFIALAEAAARADNTHADALLEAATAALPTLTNLVFLDSADVALNSPLLLRTKGRTLALALYDRVGETKDTSGLQAYAYLETLTRLGFTDDTARYRALEHLSTLGLDDPDDLLERLPKLIGLALDCWNEGGLRDRLSMLLEHDATRADAAYELAQLTLRDALQASTFDDVLAGLTSARDQFTTVESLEEAREDATLYRCALDLTVSFVAGGDSIEETATVKALTTAIDHRAAMTTRSDLGSWAAPRRQAEVEWYALARTLRSATLPLQEPSWNAPGETLSRVLAAYRASRSVTVMTGDGLHVVLEPTVEAAFLRYEGLVYHLRGLVADEGLPAEDLEVARHLIDVITTRSSPAGGDVSGKARAAAPDLAAELGEDLDAVIAAELVAASDSSPNLLRALNSEAKTRARLKARESDPIVDRLLGRVMTGLDGCPGLDGTALAEFIEMLTCILKFAADRANIGRMNGGPTVYYLFEPEDGKAFTEDFLQRDVATWLKATPLRTFVAMEQHDVAAGRADVTVTQTHKFTIEVKRDLVDVSRAALLKAYGGQAAAYSITGPSVSLEMVLDLTDQSRGTPSLDESVWVQEVPISGGKPRRVVTIVIHGNRVTPRGVKST